MDATSADRQIRARSAGKPAGDGACSVRTNTQRRKTTPPAERSCPPRLAQRRETASHRCARERAEECAGTTGAHLENRIVGCRHRSKSTGVAAADRPIGQRCPSREPFEAARTDRREAKRPSLPRPPGVIDDERRRARSRGRRAPNRAPLARRKRNRVERERGAPHSCGGTRARARAERNASSAR